jgi:hypothetical protein
MLSAFAGLPALAVISSKKAATADDLSSSVDPLPSWNKTEIKGAIVAFVNRVTNQGAPDFVPENERIATFDNDGTLWAEQPMYSQLLFVFDRVKSSAAASRVEGLGAFRVAFDG